jgi:hypothetical protein
MHRLLVALDWRSGLAEGRETLEKPLECAETRESRSAYLERF